MITILYCRILCCLDVSSHVILITLCEVCVCTKSLQSCPTLCDPIDCSPPVSSVFGDSPGKKGDLPNLGIEPTSHVSCTGRGFFTTSATCEVISSVEFSRSVVSNSATPWTSACQASLSITNSQSLAKLMSIELVMPSNPLILCRPLLLLPSIFPSIRVFSNESVLCIRWPKYWSYHCPLF